METMLKVIQPAVKNFFNYVKGIVSTQSHRSEDLRARNRTQRQDTGAQLGETTTPQAPYKSLQGFQSLTSFLMAQTIPVKPWLQVAYRNKEANTFIQNDY